MAKTDPPAPNELELSLFGPGVGESVVVHLGRGEWMVIDSCKNGKTDRPVALEYLESIGVDPSTAIKVIVVSHWHDDHIAGIAQIFNAAASAQLAISLALRAEDFFSLVLSNDQLNKLVKATSGTSEFAELLDIIAHRKAINGGGAVGPDHWAIGGKTLYSRTSADPVRVLALSPSAQTVTDCFGGIANRIFVEPDAVKKFRKAVRPNDLSIALHVESPACHFLLGGDLEVGKSEQHGWRAVVASNYSQHLPAIGYKVAHHGSKNACWDMIWSSLLEEAPLALVTPFATLKEPLPTKADVLRIKNHADKLYCTCWPPTKSPPRRRGADGLMNLATKSRRALNLVPGHIRLRINMMDPKINNVELFDGATLL